MTRSELIQNISDYISGSYGVPVKISEKEINHRINDALRWFYRYYDRAVTGKHYIINKFNLNNYWMEPDLISQNPKFETSIQNG